MSTTQKEQQEGQRPDLRNRSSSVSRGIRELNTYTDGAMAPSSAADKKDHAAATKAAEKSGKRVNIDTSLSKAEILMSKPRGGILYEFYTLRWMVDPSECQKERPGSEDKTN
jgi:hypothetical protein